MKTITFDLETIPDETRRDIIEPIIIEKLKVDKPELFGPFPEGAGEQGDDLFKPLQSEIDRRMSVTPEYCQIVCLGYAIGEEEPRTGVVRQPTLHGQAEGYITEVDLLRAFWSMVKGADTIVGYNCLNFDLQVIRVRSARLKITPTRYLWNIKPWEDTVVDVYAKRYSQGSKHVAGYRLDQVAKVERVPVPGYCRAILKSGFSGADVLTAWRSGNLESIAAHCGCDIVQTRELARLWGGYWMPALFTPWDNWDYEAGAWVGEGPEGW